MNINFSKNVDPFSIMSFNNLGKHVNLSKLSTKAKANANGNHLVTNKTKSHMNSNVDYATRRNVTKQGNDTRIELELQRNIQSNRELVKTEKINANNPGGVAEKVTKVDQLSSETLKANSVENRTDISNTTRNTERNGNVTQNNTHIDTETNGDIDSFTQVDRSTDTKTNYRT